MKIDEKRLTTSEKVQKLQSALQAKAKAEPGYRFYSLWDKVLRWDVLHEAYRRCRANGGAGGVDGETFEHVDRQGLVPWLEQLREELQTGRYRPRPLLRVWIPKSNGGQRPLGIPTLRDRVVQMAMVLIIGPIFEVDLCEEQMGFRPGRDAKLAVRLVYYQVRQKGRQEVVDADLRDYFNTIPHGALLKSLSRRIADGSVMSVIKQWLETPVEEPLRDRGVTLRTTEAADRHRGTPQGGVISPLLANVYFRRFLLAWRKLGHQERFDSVVVNYADDFVICCRRGNGPEAREAMEAIMKRIGLTVNEQKTRLVKVPEESLDFLGYTIGCFHGRDGKPYIGTRPSRKAIRRLLEVIHEQTSSQWNASSPELRVEALNQKLRGWAGYFDQGPVVKAYKLVQDYTERRLRRWLMRRRQKRGTGYRQYSDEYLYGKLGLIQLATSRTEQLQAKGLMPEGRAGCGKAARPVRGAGAGNGTMDQTEAPALW
jgi:group II intron reverse transcriptase/maturase